MTASRFQSPVNFTATQEHEVADPNRAAALYEAIPAKPEVLEELKNKHIISIKSFNNDELLELFRMAAGFEAGTLEHPQLPTGRILSDLFLDHTRPQIRLSFNHAWLKMGGGVINIEKTIQEMMANRTDAYQEVAELCNINSDLSIVLTQEDGVLEEMLQYFRIPVVNAGNGSDEHPTHALADLYTIFKWRPDLLVDSPENPLNIAIVGDPSYTRTIRSFLWILSKFPQIVARITTIDHVEQPFQPGQREELENVGLKIEVGTEVYPMETTVGINRKVLPETDLVYIHELVSKQVRRINLIEAKESLKDNTMILNPEIQVQEYANLINDSPHNAYFTQARGAYYVRMALFSAIMGLS